MSILHLLGGVITRLFRKRRTVCRHLDGSDADWRSATPGQRDEHEDGGVIDWLCGFGTGFAFAGALAILCVRAWGWLK